MNDFLIIGGGIAGLSTAARLSTLGHVRLLEAEDALGYHASGRSAAMFEQAYGNASIIALNRASKDYLATHMGGVLSPRGVMLLGLHGEDEEFAHDLAIMQMAELSVSQARQRVPIISADAVSHVGHREDSWDIDTDLLMQNFAREIRKNGGEITVRCAIQSIRPHGAGWRVETAEKTYDTRLIINAAGAWADRVAVMAGVAPLGLTPLRRSMAQIPAPGGHDVSTWPMMFGVGEAWYAKPEAGMLIVSPADEDLVEPHDAWADDLVIAEGLARYEAAVNEPVTRVVNNWAGLRTFAPDHSLVLGPDPDTPSFIWVAGQGGYGFQTSAAASKFVADQIADRPSELDKQTQAALLPARLRK